MSETKLPNTDTQKLVDEARYAMACDFTNNDFEVNDEIVKKYRDSVVTRLCDALERTQQALPDTHLLQRVKDVADGTINFGMGAALREIGKWILTGHHEPLTCANDGDYCEYSRTDCAADGSFNCQAHVREA